nr:DUF1778 domain-containing protein [Providencia sp.]
MKSMTNERITTRVSIESKELLEKAAALAGYASINSFIANTMISEAKRLITQEHFLVLSKNDALAFVNALDAPVKSNSRFLNAARKHKETVNNESYPIW